MASDWVYRTAQLSACSQVFLGLLSLIGFVRVPDDETMLLYTLLVLDATVQLVELVFYLFFIWYGRLDTAFRYLDWFVSTPTMHLSTALFVSYLGDRELSLARFFALHGRDIALVIVANELMLAFGLLYELGRGPPLTNLLGGWITFVVSFVLLFARFTTTAGGAVLLAFVFAVWSLYGVAATWSYVPKNVAYNSLDVVAKNFYGVFISIYLISE